MKQDHTNELESLREWIRSLSDEDLLRALEFEMSQEELDLISQMVKEQAPPPTPIHPGILGYRPASHLGATDGRNEEERIAKVRFQRPRLFQLVDMGGATVRNHRSSSRKSRRLLVIARKKITPWGQVLSVGCTQEQRDCDALLLQETRIHASKDRCMFCGNDNVLKILRVASRGKFLSVPLALKTRMPVCAPWMDVKEEWFSLPMYLASRFEVALWTSFRHKDLLKTRRSDSMQGAMQQLPEAAFRNALLSATVKALQKDIFTAESTMVRDGLVWNLLDSKWLDAAMQCTTTRQDSLTKVGTVALVDLNSSKHTLQKALWHHLQEAIASEKEKEILRSLSNGETAASTTAARHPKRKKTKKKKRKKESSPTSNGTNTAAAARTTDTNADIYSSATTNGKNTAPLVTETKAELHYSVMSPESIERAKEQTRKIIMAGSIIDEVLDCVFDQLGLNTVQTKQEVATQGTDDAKDASTTGLNSTQREADAVNDAENNEKTSIAVMKSTRTGKEAASTHVKGGKARDMRDERTITAAYMAANEATIKRSNRDGVTILSISSQSTGESIMAVPPKLSQDEHTLNSDASPFIPSGAFANMPQTEHQSGHQQEVEPDYFSVPWILDDTVDGWEKLKRYPNREKSLLADLFLSRTKDAESSAFVASSTAASIASSSDKGSESAENNSKLDVDDGEPATPLTPIAPVLEEAVLEAVVASMKDVPEEEPLEKLMSTKSSPSRDTTKSNSQSDMVDEEQETSKKETIDVCRSPSPPPPQTPPPQLSPILVSLADLQTIRTRASLERPESPKAQSTSAFTAGSLPSSPMPPSSVTLTPSWSREDLRIHTFADDHRLTDKRRGRSLLKRADSLSSYRKVAPKSLSKWRGSSADRKSSFAEVVSGEARLSVRSGLSVPDLGTTTPKNGSETCAQSETAFEAHSYEMPLNDVTRPGATGDNTEVTISTREDSPEKSRSRMLASSEELESVREERNAFRDMCLTLGAEVAKLKNMLAAQSGYSSHVLHSAVNQSPYEPEFVPPYFNGVPKATTIGAMSDAGVHHDSAISEDGTDATTHDTSGRPRSVHVRRMSSGATNVGSDISVEQNIGGQAVVGTASFRSLSRDVIGTLSGHGYHSRLTNDILNFLSAKRAAMKYQENRKTAAIQRLTRLVTALWPRAQVKIYGSHATGLSLPSSDLDFVICLPAVHKNAPAVAPGVLEGRNAINESSQKFLARSLKGESWIDPRSIKMIQAIVPIIKVSTKDTRARMLQLDISFDGPEHHGLAANLMIAEVLQELPMIQPLVLVLKQFLKDRGLLTAFTGGLSSYCLFLMVTRYLQEHPSSWGDCGSLLMGFLDFYGNSFDPRVTGISVGRRQYFARYAEPQQMWNVGYPQHLASTTPSPVANRPDVIRRNSFNDNATMDGQRGSSHGSRPPRFQPSSHHRLAHQYNGPTEQDAADHSGRPYTFDPLFVEDPLSVGNNVGRNAFRIFQVQRAFSDAHRALVASLEWDIHSSHDLNDGGEYPLLNCLLQSEDVFYELDDAR